MESNYKEWTAEQFAIHYKETLDKPANAWGMHVSPIFGQSHFIAIVAAQICGAENFWEAVSCVFNHVE
jgi:hypothetical protein